MASDRSAVTTREGLDALISASGTAGYRVCGPARDQAIVHDDISGTGDLPEGWSDEDDGGRYRLTPVGVRTGA